MSESLLTRIRKLNWVLSERTTGYVSFDQLCNIMSELLDSNVYIINKRGKLLSGDFVQGDEIPLIKDVDKNRISIPEQSNKKILELKETKSNMIYDSIKVYFGEEYSMADRYHTIVPIIFGGKRIASLILARANKAYDDEDIAICEYGATVVGIEVARGISLDEEQENRKTEAVDMALSTLSYSEMAAVSKIFAALEGDEGLLVASKIADKSGITRSVIVNALRKLESAGVIESRSLGMKGTRIKITNEFLRDGIKSMEL